MAAVLGTNVASLWASKNLQSAQSNMADSVERLSSGLRINRARDDAAGLGLANALTQQINASDQGIRNLNDGRVLEHTFPSGAKLEDINIEYRTYQFLYNDPNGYHFMNVDDYNQITVEENLLDSSLFLKEGEIVTVLTNTEDGSSLSVEMPQSVTLEISETEPGLKGNTATNATKPATVETGASVNVPLFINEGDKIKVETEKGTYKERIKE